MFLLKRLIFKKVGKLEYFPQGCFCLHIFTFLFKHIFKNTYIFFFLPDHGTPLMTCTSMKKTMWFAQKPSTKLQWFEPKVLSVFLRLPPRLQPRYVVYSTLISRIFFVSINFYYMCNILISRPPLRLRAVLVTVQRPPDKLVTNPMMANYDRQWETPIWGLIPWLIILRSLIKVVISRPLYR